MTERARGSVRYFWNFEASLSVAILIYIRQEEGGVEYYKHREPVADHIAAVSAK